MKEKMRKRMAVINFYGTDDATLSVIGTKQLNDSLPWSAPFQVLVPPSGWLQYYPGRYNLKNQPSVCRTSLASTMETSTRNFSSEFII